MAFFCLSFLNWTESQAGTVRTAYSDGVSMLPIQLRMGQSTVLRFIERPKKVVLGNSNYYSVEFIDNDIAIQPLGAVTTNLFVYGIKNVYGFILHTSQSANYDDLVQVDLKENKINPHAKMVLKQSPLKEISRPKLIFPVGDSLKVTLSLVQRYEHRDFYVMDLLLENISKNEVDLAKINLALNRGKIKISPQEFVLRETILKPGEMTGARVFFSADKRSDLRLDVQLKNMRGRQTILRRFL